jgi:hypothetical protein
MIIVLLGTFLFWNWFWNMEPPGAQPSQAIGAAPLQSVTPARILAHNLPGRQHAAVNAAGSAKPPPSQKASSEPLLWLDHGLFSFF